MHAVGEGGHLDRGDKREVELEALLSRLEDDERDERPEGDVDRDQDEDQPVAAGGFEKRPGIPDQQHEREHRGRDRDAQKEVESGSFPTRHCCSFS